MMLLSGLWPRLRLRLRLRPQSRQRRRRRKFHDGPHHLSTCG